MQLQIQNLAFADYYYLKRIFIQTENIQTFK